MASILALGCALALAPAARAMMPESGGWWDGADLVNVAKLKAAQALYQEEKYDGAIRLVLSVVRADGENADAWTLLGFGYRKTGNFEGAHEAYDKALALKPDHVYARQYYGELLLMEGNLDGALQQRAVLLAECPQGCEPLAALDQAIAEFRAQPARPQG